MIGTVFTISLLQLLNFANSASSVKANVCARFVQINAETGCTRSLHEVHPWYASYQQAFRGIYAATATGRVKLCTAGMPKCTVTVCGYDVTVHSTKKLETRIRTGNERCYKFLDCDKNGWTMPKFFDISTTHCECEGDRHMCETSCQQREIYDFKVCAIAYGSQNCRDCAEFGDKPGCHFQRSDEYTYNAQDVESFKALKLRKGCTLVVQNITQDGEQNKLVYKNSVSNWKLNAGKGLMGFFCSCPDDDEVMSEDVVSNPINCDNNQDICPPDSVNQEIRASVGNAICRAVEVNITFANGTGIAHFHQDDEQLEIEETVEKQAPRKQIPLGFIGIYLSIMLAAFVTHFVKNSKSKKAMLHNTSTAEHIQRITGNDSCSQCANSSNWSTQSTRGIGEDNYGSSGAALIHSDCWTPKTSDIDHSCIPLQPWNTKESLVLLTSIGRGSYGCVYKVKDLAELENVEGFAVKCIDIQQTFRTVQKGGERLKGIVNEIKILNDLTNENVIRCYESWAEDFEGNALSRDGLEGIIERVEAYYQGTSFSSSSIAPEYFRCRMFIKMELCQGTLKQWMSVPREESFNLLIKEVFPQLLKGLKFIAGKKYIHRDIKPDNIFFRQDGNNISWKIADFGLAIKEEHGPKLPVGTEVYRSPEMKNLDYGCKSDVYSMGLVMAQVFVAGCGRRELKNNCLEGLRNCTNVQTFLRQRVEFIPEFENVINLLARMLEKDTKKRWTAEESLVLMTKSFETEDLNE